MKTEIREMLFPSLKNTKTAQREIERLQREITDKEDRPKEELLGLVKDMLSDLAHDS